MASDDRNHNHIKARVRDRDQRMPTFHMLVDHDQHHHTYHFHHQGKHEGEDAPRSSRVNASSKKTGNNIGGGGKIKSPSKSAANFDKVNLTPSPSSTEKPQKQKQRQPPASGQGKAGRLSKAPVNNPLPPLELLKTGASSESVSSVGSYRSPACNFSQFYVHSADEADAPEKQEKKKETRKQENFQQQRKAVSNPTTPRMKKGEMERLDEEPSDVVVWNNPTTNVSRSKVNSHLVEAEVWNVTLNQVDTNSNPMMRRKAEAVERRARSSSVPHSNAQNKQLPLQHPEFHALGLTSSLLFHTNDLDVELLEDCIPPARETASSVSLVSTYSLQIALVTQQLEHIQQAQNDILKQLGEDISKVNFENEKLKKEIDHVRSQNEGLLKVIDETTGQLERMKQIFRMRSIPVPSPGPDTDIVDSLIPSITPPSSPVNIHDRDRDHDRPRSASPPPHAIATARPPSPVERKERRSHRRSRSHDRDHENNDNDHVQNHGDVETKPDHEHVQNSPRQSHNHHNNHGQLHRGSGEKPFDIKSCVGQTDTHMRSNKSRKKKQNADNDDSDLDEEKLTNGCYLGMKIMVNHDDEDSNSNVNVCARNNSMESYNSVENNNSSGSGPRRRRRSRSRERRGDPSNTGTEAPQGQGHGHPRGESKYPRRNRSQNKLNPPTHRPHPQHSTRESKQDLRIRHHHQQRQRGCLSRMFGCCFADQSYRKDYDDDMSMLHDYR